MTYLYEYFGFPPTYSVKCPDCESECQGKDVHILQKRHSGTYTVNSHYLIKEKDKFLSDLSCLSCGLNKRVMLSWPEDAYWHCTIKGQVLWAWSRQDVSTILNYLESGERTTLSFKLLHLPKHFKLAKNRNASVKALKQLLNEKT